MARPSPIRFDHATHLLKHFREQRAKSPVDSAHAGVEGTSESENSVVERTCAGCHTTVNGAGSLSVARDLGYESCRDCHERPLQQSLAGGVVLLSLPMLDTEALA
ncbi:MAG: hypothetical protein KDB14_06030, partial [Planctomycetales bacterium]|nr:hypothetical protein [Planctomycetales bacterium]